MGTISSCRLRGCDGCDTVGDGGLLDRAYKDANGCDFLPFAARRPMRLQRNGAAQGRCLEPGTRYGRRRVWQDRSAFGCCGLAAPLIPGRWRRPARGIVAQLPVVTLLLEQRANAAARSNDGCAILCSDVL